MATDSAYPAIILARMSSTRLPGKALRLVNGRPLISFVIETLKTCSNVSDVVLATSADQSDDQLANFASNSGVTCFRGELNNASNRFLKAMLSTGSTAAFRVNGDSPFVSRELLSVAAEVFSTEKHDLVTNVHPRSFPAGMSVELVSAEGYERAYGSMSLESDFEHVTRFLYSNADQFRIYNIVAREPSGHLQLAVDTPEDWEVMLRILEGMQRPHWDYTVSETVDLLRRTRVEDGR